jgi:antitoxin component YwqK of YwqJK toxin-antitoxin module
VVGTTTEYYADCAVKRTLSFKDNRIHGEERLYDPDGTLSRTKYWHNGESVTEEEYRARR